MRKSHFWVTTLLAAAGFFSIAPIAGAVKNSIEITDAFVASEKTARLHQKLFIADLHNDAMLWDRSFLEKSLFGHSDLPRHQEGNIGLQVFSVVTKTPRDLNYESNTDESDNITLLTVTQMWPSRTWNSLLERSLYQSEKLHAAITASAGKMRMIRFSEDLESIGAPSGLNGALGSVLALEGLNMLEGNLDNLDKLYNADFRIAGLAHFYDNEVGGSAQGSMKGGLTPFGRKVVERLEQRKMLIDVAHASSQLIDDVLANATRPVLVSHTGVKGTCPSNRNLSDAHVKAIAATGGLIGIGFFEEAVCALSVDAIVKAIRYTVDLVGVKHVALGSDFDGAVRVVFGSEGLSRLTQGLIENGFSDADIASIMGGNVRDLLLAQLPKRSDSIMAFK